MEPAPITMFRRGLRLLGILLRHHPAIFAVSVAGATVFSLASVAATLVLGWATDEVVTPTFETGQADSGAVWWAMAAIMAVAFLRASGVIVRRFFAAMTSRRCQVDLRESILDRFTRVPLAWIRSQPTGRLLAHADNDVLVTTDFINPLPFSIGAVVLALVSLVALLAIDLLMAGVAIVIFPALWMANHLYTAAVEAPAARTQEAVGEVSTLAHESFDGALVVKTLGREQAESERMRAVSDQLRQARLRVGRLRATFEPGLDSIPNVGIIALLLIGTWRLSTGAVTTGNLVQAAALFSILALPVRVLGYFLEEMPRAVVAHDRIEPVLDVADAPEHHATTSLALPDGPLSVEFDDVVFGYESNGRPVLNGITLGIEPGEVVAVVGATGAGKSTLTHLLVRLADPGSGSIRLGGIDLTDIDSSEMRGAVSAVFQESFLFADDILANISLGDDGSAARAGMAAGVARAEGFIGELPQGWDTVVGERGVTLSGGQRQRVALSRALSRDPRLLILDDATSAVDPVVEQQILAGLRERLGTTTLIVAQRVSTIELADRVIFIADGRVAASGPHRDLLARPDYEALVRAYEQGEMA
ncbi:MAG: ABC transporter ATP-binding protein [Actinomycetia bacterium]|nr:ABC transporter ATP-binding protein [Actinomycetes bacterium]MCP3909686.1 ABC transporter ATP-binding protein [Actinomycetes bacterium]MCP4083867.1 ABC transporter ATP-binding protein [Actinomycetes bacterium]